MFPLNQDGRYGNLIFTGKSALLLAFQLEPVVGIEPTTYGLRNRHYLHDAACKRSKAQHNKTRSSLVEWEWTDKMFPFVPTGLAEDEEKKHSFLGQGKSSAPHSIPLFGGGSLPRIPPLKISGSKSGQRRKPVGSGWTMEQGTQKSCARR